MTPPVCASWCGKESDRLTWTVLRDGKVIRLCSRECWLAGRPVNPAPVEPCAASYIDEFLSDPDNRRVFNEEIAKERAEDEGATDADE